MEKRGGALISIDQAELISRLKNYYDKSIDWDGYKLSRMPLAKNAARFDAKNAREKVIAKEKFDPQRVVRYFVRPFDIRYAYYTGIRPIWNEPRPQLWTQYVTGNRFVVSRPARVADPEGVPLCLTRCLGDNDAFRGHAYYIPVRKHHDAVGMLAGSSTENLSNRTRAYLKSLGYSDPDQDPTAAEVIWLHALAIGFSQRYRVDNADGLTIGWPRIPLPNGRDALDASTTLGRRLAALLDTENEVPGVTIGNVAEQYRILGTISASDLMVSAGWGRAGSKGSVSPGPGKVMARDWTKVEHDALEAGFTAAKIDSARGFELLGQPNDVFLNGDTYWRAVPEQVWEFYIGGYQVIKEMAVVS